MEIHLVRSTMALSLPQIGTLHVGGAQLDMLTGELPNRQNTPFTSCIPEGRYIWHKRASDKTDGMETIAVLDVPGRSGILFHWGNAIWRDTKGCILVGLSLDYPPSIEDKAKLPMLLRSKEAWNRLMKLTEGAKSGTLYISHAF